MAYLLDTNVFIQAKDMHYGFDFCPAFWDWLIDSHAGGRVFSIDKVVKEIAKGEDKLTRWVHGDGNGLFRKTDKAVTDQLSQVSTWVDSQKYVEGAKKDFFDVADYFLVAYALAGGHIVVTHEVTNKNATNKVKIPDVCKGLELGCMTPFEMLRVEEAKFVLGDRQS